MAHAVVLFFDTESAAAVRAMWATLEARGLPSMATARGRHMPHVTLAVADRIAHAQATAASEPLRTANDLVVQLGSVAVFPGRAGVLYLAVVPTLRLLHAHHQLHARLAGAGVESRRHYLPDAWVPHCTLAEGLTSAQIAAGVQSVERQRAIMADVSTVALVDTDTGDVTTLVEVPRSSNAE